MLTRHAGLFCVNVCICARLCGCVPVYLLPTHCPKLQDATKLFNKYHAWVNISFMLRNCYVGPLDSSGDSSEDSSEGSSEDSSEDSEDSYELEDEASK